MQNKRHPVWQRVAVMLLSAVTLWITAAAPVSARPVSHYGWPARSRVVTSEFGPRAAPCRGCSSQHKGMDIAGRRGDPVYAARTGVVTFAGWQRGYGKVVYLGHPGGAETRYAHLHAIYVGKGQRVHRGQQIGQIGATGIGNGRPHLHFEIRDYGRALNPRWLV